MRDEMPASGQRGSGLPLSSMRRRRRSSGPPWGTIALVAILLLGIGLGSWLWLRSAAEGDAPAPAPTTAVGEEAGDVGPAVPPLDLPELGASDAFIREVVGRLSAHPQLARWLVTEGLVHRFVGSVVALAGGNSPSAHLEFMAPTGDFRTRATDGRLTVDPASHRRYDLITQAFVSLDTQGSALLYRQLVPLFEEAYAELGIPDHTFEETFAMAVSNVLAARVPEGEIEVVPDEAVYAYRDPALEGASPAAKHLVRMGGGNARQIQAKLAELARELGLSPVG
jgi:hypothetical protein